MRTDNTETNIDSHSFFFYSQMTSTVKCLFENDGFTNKGTGNGATGVTAPDSDRHQFIKEFAY